MLALAVSGSDLYVGGGFSETTDGGVTNLWRIARYSGGAWSAFAHKGLNNYVTALAVSGSDLYVGGYFTQTVDGAIADLNYIAMYSGGAWSALAHNGLNNYVYALAVSGSDLYAGGLFTKTADLGMNNLNFIAEYSGGGWSALAHNGFNNVQYGNVGALAVSGSDLYAGGEFTQTFDGTVKDLNSIARLGASAATGYHTYLPVMTRH